MVEREVLYVVAIVVGIASFLVVLLVPMSFSGIEYNEYGFTRRKTTGNVNEEKVYYAGHHFIGPDYEFRKFLASAHFDEFNAVTVFTSDRLQVTLTARLQYFLRPDQLAFLFREYDIYYKDIIHSNANDALKATSTIFSTREFILERRIVEAALFKAIRERLGGKCCEKDCEQTDSCHEGCLEYFRCTTADWGLYVDVRYFQLHQIVIPEELDDRYLASLVLNEETETELLKQEAIVIRKQTDAMVKQIENEATEISQNATASASLIISKATATSEASVQNAKTEGLRHIYTYTQITNEEEKMSFDYLRTLRSSHRAHLAVDYQNLIAGAQVNKP